MQFIAITQLITEFPNKKQKLIGLTDGITIEDSSMMVGDFNILKKCTLMIRDSQVRN